jgi:hypothetical protein
MSDLPDPLLWRLLEHIGPWVGNLGGLIACFIAWAYNGIRREMKETSDDLRKLRAELPITYASKPDTARALDDINATMNRHMDTITTDVRTLNGDVKKILELIAKK